jgi:hypothetical protein
MAPEDLDLDQFDSYLLAILSLLFFRPLNRDLLRMLDTLLLALPESSQEFFAGGWVETDFFDLLDLEGLATFEGWTHGVKKVSE